MADQKSEDLDCKNRTEESDFTDHLQSDKFKFEIKEKFAVNKGGLHHEIDQTLEVKPLLAVAETLESSKEVSVYCDLCNLNFNNTFELEEHMQDFNTNKPLECMQCSITLSSKHNLIKHTSAHTEYFTCNLCKMSFSKLNDIIIHTATIHEKESLNNNISHKPPTLSKQNQDISEAPKKRKYICDLCDVLFDNHADFKKHLVSFNETKKLRCTHCGDEVITYHALVNHILTHTGNLTCTVCRIEFPNRSDFLAHSETHTGQGPFPCGDCKRTFISLKNLAKHRITHLELDDKAVLVAKRKAIWSPREEPGQICKTCSLVFEKDVGYKMHMQEYNATKPCYCTRCGEMFSSIHDYIIHNSSHIGDYTCPTCKTDFILEQNFESHIDKKHDGETNFLCTECHKEFKNLEELIKHIANVHPVFEQSDKVKHCNILKENRRELRRKTKFGQVIYYCNLCKKTYLENQYNIHKEKHFGKVWYLCGKCDEFFEDWKTCTRHQEAEHVD